MSIQNTEKSFGIVARTFHWLIVLLIIGSFGTMITVEELPENSSWVGILYNYHKSIGITILALVAFRLLWRLMNVVPKPAPGLPKWQIAAAHAAHYLLYFAMFALPISGLVFNKYPVEFYYLFQIQPLETPFVPEVKKMVKEFHEIFAWIVLGVVGAHASAALWHHFVRKDNTLRRMISG